MATCLYIYLYFFKENVPLEVKQNLFLQMDGCPANFAINVREHLKALFQQQWIVRGTLLLWPARSRNSACLDDL